MKKNYKLTSLALIGALSVTMIGQPLLSKSNPKERKLFKHLAKTWQEDVDSNQDKLLSLEEFKKYSEQIAEKKWKKLTEKLDSNKDGLLAQSELDKMKELKREHKKRGRRTEKEEKTESNVMRKITKKIATPAEK